MQLLHVKVILSQDSNEEHHGFGHHNKECGPRPTGLEDCNWKNCPKEQSEICGHSKPCPQGQACCTTACCTRSCNPIVSPSK